MHTAVALYCIAVGILMTVWWTASLRRGVLRRHDRSRSEMTLHILAEALTAILLVASGLTLLVIGDGAIPVATLALGMLLYTVIVSPGYFVARHEPEPVYMFGGLMMLTVAGAVVLVT